MSLNVLNVFLESAIARRSQGFLCHTAQRKAGIVDQLGHLRFRQRHALGDIDSDHSIVHIDIDALDAFGLLQLLFDTVGAKGTSQTVDPQLILSASGKGRGIPEQGR